MSILEQLVLIIFLGTMSQWIGWKFNLPSILLLLVFGIVFGPVMGLIHPDTNFWGSLDAICRLFFGDYFI